MTGVIQKIGLGLAASFCLGAIAACQPTSPKATPPEPEATEPAETEEQADAPTAQPAAATSVWARSRPVNPPRQRRHRQSRPLSPRRQNPLRLKSRRLNRLNRRMPLRLPRPLHPIRRQRQHLNPSLFLPCRQSATIPIRKRR